MADDFLFDPWSSREGGEAPPLVEPISAEPDAAADTPEGRPAPQSGSRWRARAVPGPIPVERPVPFVRPVDGAGGASIARRGSTADPAPRARSGSGRLPSKTRSTISRLRAIARPKLEEVAARLHIARHHTLVDDRLDNKAGVIRFRLVPRPAPFDEPPAVPGSVLELVATEATVEARLWLDPVAEEPAEDLEIPASQFTEEWLHGVVVDFVARTLRQG